jgi:uncharacterized protein YdhG (YjbR/CyaY superfamily)
VPALRGPQFLRGPRDPDFFIAPRCCEGSDAQLLDIYFDLMNPTWSKGKAAACASNSRFNPFVVSCVIVFPQNMTKKITTIDDYILAQEPEAQEILTKIRKLIKKLAPSAEEKICYGIPTFKLKRNLVHFAAFKTHIGFYPTASGTRFFQEKLAGFKHGKGSIQFPIDQPIPYKLIEEITKFRINEELTK